MEFQLSINPSNEYSGLISFDGLVGSPCSPRDSQESSPVPQFKSINSLVLSFIVQLSHLYLTTGKTIALTKWTIFGKVMSLFFIMLSRLDIAFLPRNKLFNFMVTVTSAVILEPAKLSLLLFPLFPIYLP